MKRLQEGGQKVVPGEFIFKLYDTFGFPVDIVKDIAIEKGMLADEAGFNAAMEVQHNQSKKSWKATSLAEMGPGVRSLLDKGLHTRFVGYETRHHHGVISGLVSAGGIGLEQAGTGEQISLVCPETPFYAVGRAAIGA